jgi:nucleotidyltransferase substrate binding protein (TIGR01987 family)
MIRNTDDIRWKQRFSNYKKALEQLTKFIEKKDLSELERQGLIKSFEYTFELAWNVLKDFLEYQGINNIIGSRDTVREAYKNAIIEDGQDWMNMIESRNKTSHSYNEEIAIEIANEVMNKYYFLFIKMKNKMKLIDES